MFKNIFKKQINSVAVAAALVAVSSLASRVLGFLRDRVLAARFGAGQEVDIYYAAFKVPDLVYNLLVLGALSAGFIPVFTKLIKDFNCRNNNCHDNYETNKGAWDLVNNIVTILFFSVSFLSILGIIFSPALTKIVAPGFSPEDQLLTSNLTRIMFLSPLLLGISGIIGGVLQSFKRFLIYSIAPIFYNLGIIFGATILVDAWGLIGLAWGVVIGAFLHLAIQLPTVFSLGFRYRFSFSLKDKNVREIFRVMIPRTMSLAISQVNLLVITAIASGLAAGSLTIFNFANNLQSFPVGIFGISFAIAAFPLLSEHAFNKEKLAKSFSKTFRQILFFVVPATALLIILRAQIVRIVYGAGNFDWNDTILTMNTLAFFSISLFAQATIPLLVRVFYARHNSKLPFYLGLITVASNVVLSILLSRRMGVTGLALAFSISSILNFLLLFFWLTIEAEIIKIGEILVSVIKFTLATILGGSAAQLTKYVISPYVNMTKFEGVFIQLCLAGGVGLVFYIISCYFLRSPELMDFIDTMKRRSPFKKLKIGDQGEARGI